MFSTVSVGIASCSAFLTHRIFSEVKNLCHFIVCKISEQNNWKHVIHYKFCNVLCVLNLKERDISVSVPSLCTGFVHTCPTVFTIIDFCNPGIHYEMPCIMVQFCLFNDAMVYCLFLLYIYVRVGNIVYMKNLCINKAV